MTIREADTGPRRERGCGQRALLLVLAFALLSLLLVACSSAGSDPAAKEPSPSLAGEEPPQQAETPAQASSATSVRDGKAEIPVSSIAGGDSRMDVIIAGQRIPLLNGGSVNLGDGLTVEAFLDPYPPTKLRVWLDLYLTNGPGGTPVDDADVSIDYDMRFMYHGPFQAVAENLGEGHYLFTLDYIMYGGWDQLVKIRMGEESFELPILVIASPKG